MSCKALQREVEAKLNAIDPVGAKLRRLRRRLAFLTTKGTVSAKEYKEITSGALKVADLEAQRKDWVRFESTLNPKLGKLLRISNAYDKLTIQYDAGKVEESLYADSLRKLYNRLNEPSGAVVAINVKRLNQPPLGHTVAATLEQAFAAVIVIFVLIPALFACSVH